MGDYNREHRSNPITTKTVGEAYKNKQRSLMNRVMGNKAQERTWTGHRKIKTGQRKGSDIVDRQWYKRKQ